MSGPYFVRYDSFLLLIACAGSGPDTGHLIRDENKRRLLQRNQAELRGDDQHGFGSLGLSSAHR